MKKAKAGTFKKVLSYMKRYIPVLVFSLVLSVITVALTLYFPILTGRAIDLIVGKGDVDFAAMKVILLKAAVVVVIAAFAQWLTNICNNRMTYNIVRDIRHDAFLNIEKMPLSYIDSHSHGDMVSRIIADVDTFSDGLLMGFTQLFTGIATIIGTLIFMLTIDVKISIVVVLITPLSLFVASFITKKTYSMFQLQTKTRGEQTALIDEVIGNQKVVQAFNHEDESLEQFDEINERLQKYSLRAIFFSSLTNPSTRVVNSIVYASVGVFGAVSAIAGGITVGQLSCFLSYANQYTKPFNEISGVITEFQNALACAARIFELIEENVEIPDEPDAIELKEADGRVNIEDVYFSYVPDKKLIEGFNLNVEPGQRVAIVGPTGCGKSTTLAAMVNEINSTRQGHIVTLEDPIEYLHKHNKCIVNQREIGKDTKSYQSALRAVLREDPDVILVGEMRDFETISVAITAAETGHLVFSTLHTIGAAKTIERIIDVFPPHQQQQIKIQLASVLKAVVSQQLVETIDGNGRVPSMEIMVTTPGIQNLIREGKTQQIESAVQTGNKYGMRTMDMSLAELCKRGVISQDTAMTYAVDGETLKRLLML